MRPLFSLILTSLLCLHAVSVQAVDAQYSSQRLQRLMQAVQTVATSSKRHAVTVLPSDTLQHVPTISEYVDVVIRHDAARPQVVNHIGLALPPIESIGDYSQIPVLQFVERYLLELLVSDDEDARNDLHVNHVELYSDKLTGTPRQMLRKALKEMDASTQLSIEQENQKYRVVFLKNSLVLLSVSMPARYDLILGQTKDEAEEAFAAHLSNEALKPLAHQGLAIKEASLRADSLIYIYNEYNWYMSPDIKGTCYLLPMQGGGFAPIYDENHRSESVINLFNYPMDFGPDADITFKMYHGKRKAQMSLAKLMECLRQQGCTIYTALTEADDKGHYHGVVYAVNQMMGYHHQLSFDAPPSVTYRPKQAPVVVELTTYVPTHNVSGMK